VRWLENVADGKFPTKLTDPVVQLTVYEAYSAVVVALTGDTLRAKPNTAAAAKARPITGAKAFFIW
jgi:hypothetical protein